MTFNFTNLKIGSLVEMELMDEHNNMKKLKTIVEDVVDASRLVLFSPVTRGKNFPLRIGQSFTLITVFKYPTVDKYDILSCRCKIVEKKREGAISTVEVVKTGPFSQIQRRNYFRLPLIKNIEIGYDNKKYDLLSKDLSGSGIRGYISKKIPAGTEDILYLDIDTKMLELKFKVVECNPDPEHSYRYELRANFVNIKNTQLSQLLKYIFSKQSEAIRKQIDLKEYVSILDTDQNYSDYFSMSNLEKIIRLSPISLWALTLVEYGYLANGFRDNNKGINFFFGEFTKRFKPEMISVANSLAYIIFFLCILAIITNTRFNSKTKVNININLGIILTLSVIMMFVYRSIL